jgi:hypothetical protein
MRRSGALRCTHSCTATLEHTQVLAFEQKLHSVCVCVCVCVCVRVCVGVHLRAGACV